MAYSASKIEFLRFGSQVGGEGIGCCAIDIVQGFVNDPDAKAVVELRDGDSQTPLFNGKSRAKYGPTNRDIFENYLRTGTFGTRELPNHIFLASLTEYQCGTDIGKKWLAILKENGFEFIRATDNSVYSGVDVKREKTREGRPVYLFGLFRNIGSVRLEDPLKPPQAWLDLPDSPDLFDKWLSGSTKFYTEEKKEPKQPPPSPFNEAAPS